MSDPARQAAAGVPPDRATVPRSSFLVITALVLAECVSAFEAGMVFIALPRFGEIFGAPPHPRPGGL